jgi:hypothetical protein
MKNETLQTEKRTAAINIGFVSCGVTCKLEALCFVSSSVLADSLVLEIANFL